MYVCSGSGGERLCAAEKYLTMGTQDSGRKRLPNRERLTAEDDALNVIAREAEARLAAKRAARAEAREIRMKELEKQQNEKKYHMLDSKWSDIEQWMEESERYSYHRRRGTSISDDEERMSVGSRGCLRVEDRSDRDLLEKGSRASTLASLSRASSRRGSGDASTWADSEASVREMKDALAEAEEKYRKAMVSNAQLDNEKSKLMYQVDVLKDSLMELEEQLSESRREYEEKVKEFEREKHAHGILKFQFSEMKEMLQQSEELLTEIRQLRLKQDGYVREIQDLHETLEWKDKKIGALERQKEYSDAVQNERDDLRDEVLQLRDILKKHGIVLGPDLNANGETGAVIDRLTDADSAQDSQTAHTGGDSVLEIRLRKLVDEREGLVEQVKRLKAQLDQKHNRTEESAAPDEGALENGTDPHILDIQRDANRHISELKFKLVKSEQEVTALEQNVTRLEGQVTRYKSAAENAEKVEDELKAEKRKMQRELRGALDRIDELEASNSHLSKRLEKMKANRSAMLAQQ
ncbi:leucine-rich repeat flightless-interacting protein 2-like isoform X3 [Scleropages formosus]|uniref:leucine-rich repeat flightless-interacting protein 2-like isoform X3 n=1 Tax=Scleropages formosus TaxID=113540 RepID=UPI0010FA7EDF|nr:leucine-rich repeat flightless-interacting protein 1 isoform X3 [Scleropages formosus]